MGRYPDWVSVVALLGVLSVSAWLATRGDSSAQGIALGAAIVGFSCLGAVALFGVIRSAILSAFDERDRRPL